VFVAFTFPATKFVPVALPNIKLVSVEVMALKIVVNKFVLVAFVVVEFTNSFIFIELEVPFPFAPLMKIKPVDEEKESC
jgi:hypothetical protein